MAADGEKDRLIRRRVLWSTATNAAAKVLSLGLGFLVAPFILHHLGPVYFGLWALVGSVVEYGALLDLGISTGLIKYVAEFRARGRDDEVRRLIATALQLYSLLGAVAIVLAVIVAPLFPHLFHVPVAAHRTAFLLVILAGINLGISLPSGTLGATLRGLQRFDLANLLAVTGTVVSTAVTVAVLATDHGVLAMVAGGTLVTLLLLPPSVALVRKAAPEIEVRWRGSSRQMRRTLFSYSASLFVIQVSGQVKTRTDALVIGAFLPVSSVTPYAFALRLSDLPRVLTDQFMKVLLPLASELHAENDEVRLRALYVTSTRLTLALLLPLAGVMVLLGGPILSAWIGGGYGTYGYLIVVLTIAIAIDTSLWPAGSVLQGMARQGPLAVVTVLSAAVNLGLSIVLVHRFGIGGVAMGTLIPNALEAALFVFPYTMRVLKVSLQEVLEHIFWPVLMPLAPLTLVILAGERWLTVSSPPVLVAVAGAGIAAYLAAYVAFGAREYEREAYRSLAMDAARLARPQR